MLAEGLLEFFKQSKNPLVCVGMLPPQYRTAVAELLLKWELPTYFEGISGLREGNQLSHFKVHSPQRFIETSIRLDCPVDGVIRMGGVPTLRLWRDLESKYSALPVLSLSHLRFSGLSRPSFLEWGDLSALCEAAQAYPIRGGTRGLTREFNGSRVSSEKSLHPCLQLDHEIQDRLNDLLREEPLSEPGIISYVSQSIPKKARIYLGNSLPIREWDLAATHEDRQWDVWASRGLNGIDGQVSTFLGFAEPGFENWAVFGDLTSLYDLQAPWILPQLEGIQVNIVVINNGGGKIFSGKFPQKEFQNIHGIRFKAWAELWGLDYEKWERSLSDLGQASKKSRIIEVIPDESSTQRFWKKNAQILINTWTHERNIRWNLGIK